MRASLLFALAHWRPSEFAEWGPSPDFDEAQRELEAALAAYGKRATSRTAG